MEELPKRKPIRAKGFDYSEAGAYFVTICTEGRKHILSEITTGENIYDTVGCGALDALNAPRVKLTQYGEIVEKYIISTNNIKNVNVEKYVIMPNHIHMIIVVDNNGTPKASSPTNAVIPHVISTFKRFINREIGHPIFQRSYHDHIIRNEKDYTEIYQYIENNPARWAEDKYYQP